MVSIQSSHTSPSKCRCSSPFGSLMTCSLLTSLLCSLNCLSCDDVIHSISCLCSFGYLIYGDVIYDIVIFYLTTFTTSGITLTTIGTAYGSTIPFIIFCAFKYVLSCTLFTPKPEAPPSSTQFFLLKSLIGKSTTTLFWLYNVVYISSLVILTLVDGFCGLSF